MMSTVRVFLLAIFIYEHSVKCGVCNKTGSPYNYTILDYNDLIKVANSSLTHNYDAVLESEILATTPDFVRRSGYPVETHTVLTEDGYLLTVFRIPGSPKAASSGVKTPVLLIHGATCTSDHFLMIGADYGLGFVLADQGYDVWLGNTRGNFYSRKHVTLSPKNPKFWDFSVHESGIYDLPAMIDHVLETTSHQRLFFVCHSVGCNLFFVLTSMRPDYNQKIRLGVNMGPYVFSHPIRLPLYRTGAKALYQLYAVLNVTGMHEFAPRIKAIQLFLGQACREGSPLLEICMFFYRMVYGFNPETFDKKTVHILFSHLQGGTSINTMAHLGENTFLDRFQMFDRSIRVGRRTQEYNLSQVTAPVYIIYGENDYFVHPDAVMKLSSRLRNVVRLLRLPDKMASHMDLVFSKNARQDFYNTLLNEMKRY